jgi:uncharacterized protein (DUF1330 family)
VKSVSGGQFIVRGANMTVLEGEWPQPRLAMIEFPSRAAAEDWYKSPTSSRGDHHGPGITG